MAYNQASGNPYGSPPQANNQYGNPYGSPVRRLSSLLMIRDSELSCCCATARNHLWEPRIFMVG